MDYGLWTTDDDPESVGGPEGPPYMYGVATDTFCRADLQVRL